jgi:hypothetical protein
MPELERDKVKEEKYLCHHCRKEVVLTNDPKCETAGFLLGIHQGGYKEYRHYDFDKCDLWCKEAAWHPLT